MRDTISPLGDPVAWCLSKASEFCHDYTQQTYYKTGLFKGMRCVCVCLRYLYSASTRSMTTRTLYSYMLYMEGVPCMYFTCTLQYGTRVQPHGTTWGDLFWAALPLLKLFPNQVWKQPKVWQGFIKCCEVGRYYMWVWFESDPLALFTRSPSLIRLKCCSSSHLASWNMYLWLVSR